MKTYIALLRGINVGGHKKVPMADLRDVLTKSGRENLKTYIQSGNVIFQSLKEYKGELEVLMHNAIMAHVSFDVPILVRSTNEIISILEGCPFPEENKVYSYFIMLRPPQNIIYVMKLQRKYVQMKNL